MTQRSIAGVFPPIPTPFHADGSLDERALSSNLDWWNGYALSGFVVLGSNGEAAHLTESEKLRIITLVRDQTPEDRLVIAGTGLFSTAATIELTRRAASAGAQAALVLPPFFFRMQMEHDALRSHFEAVADASPIPVVIYNMPANTGVDLDAQLLIELAGHENLIGVKDSSGNVAKLSEIRRHVPERFTLLAGSAGSFLPALAIGADGGVLALANIAPDLCLGIYRLAQEGAWEAARELQARIVRANAAVTRRWGVPALKAAMDVLGLAGGIPRAPLLPLDAAKTIELRTILNDAGIPASEEAS